MHEAGRLDRAKQFVPFAALRGYYEMLEDTMRYREERRELLPDQTDALDAMLQTAEVGDTVSVRHRKNGAYITTHGEVKAIREEDGVLVVDDLPIPVVEIADMEL